jgi:hypothetical protein
VNEIDLLARRVRWFDDNRRTIRIWIALSLAALGMVIMPRVLGGDWPTFHARLSAIALALALTFVIDVGLAGMISVWEVRHDRLARAGGLPRAVLRKR